MVHGVGSRLDPGDFHGLRLVEGNHDLVFEDAFGNGAERLPGPDFVAHRHGGSKLPLRFPIERNRVLPAWKEESVFVREHLKRVLQSVENRAKEARARFTTASNRVSDGIASRLVINCRDASAARGWRVRTVTPCCSALSAAIRAEPIKPVPPVMR